MVQAAVEFTYSAVGAGWMSGMGGCMAGGMGGSPSFALLRTRTHSGSCCLRTQRYGSNLLCVCHCPQLELVDTGGRLVALSDDRMLLFRSGGK